MDKDDFWLAVHALSESYLAGGASPQERTDAIAERFLAMPSMVRRALLDDLWPIAANLPDVYTVMFSLHEKAERFAAGRDRTA